MIDKNKSVGNSEAGKALVTASGVVLVFGIIAAIIIFITSFETVSNGYFSKTVFNWAGLASAIEVLFGSIFIYIFGKTVAAIANYAEAIYKNQNPDHQYDRFIANGCKFLPGDKAIYKDEDKEQDVLIKEITDEQGYYRYTIELANGEIKQSIRPYNLRTKVD